MKTSLALSSSRRNGRVRFAAGRRAVALTAILLVIAILAGCGQNVTPSPSPTVAPSATSAPVSKATASPTATAAPVVKATADPSQAKWDSTVAAGKQEGEILAYFNAPSSAIEAIPAAFTKKFGIKMNVVVGNAAELTARVNTEYRANLHQVDVILVGSSTLWTNVASNGFLAPVKPILILPEVTDGTKWRGGQLPLFDKKGQVLSYLAQVIPPIVYSTDFVKHGQVTSYNDLLKPEWKDKIVMFDPTVGGAAQFGITTLNFQWSLDRAKQYLSSLLTQQNAVIVRDQGQQMDWVSKGKYSIALWPQTPAVAQYLSAGVPLGSADIQEQKAASASNGGLAVGVSPAHPNATATFVNWFLSQEGQALAVQTMGAPSTRVDVPTTGVADMFIIKPGSQVIMQNEELTVLQSTLVDGWKQVIAAAAK